ncbi:unnamed protein product [Dovyalis caffra]|uniref:Glutathione S-transferase n=1 Tax=Dovyalis caffra TaxID=77055 RepID=A0AAV1RC62_9ROSI|nr:unnamed protein product [Dovyalis caffra]
MADTGDFLPPICESLVTVEYIDAVWSSGPSVVPSDPYDRAVARFWAAYLDEKRTISLEEIKLGTFMTLHLVPSEVVENHGEAEWNETA